MVDFDMAKERNLIGPTFDCIALLRREQFAAITHNYQNFDTGTSAIQAQARQLISNRQ